MTIASSTSLEARLGERVLSGLSQRPGQSMPAAMARRHVFAHLPPRLQLSPSFPQTASVPLSHDYKRGFEREPKPILALSLEDEKGEFGHTPIVAFFIANGEK